MPLNFEISNSLVMVYISAFSVFPSQKINNNNNKISGFNTRDPNWFAYTLYGFPPIYIYIYIYTAESDRLPREMVHSTCHFLLYIYIRDLKILILQKKKKILFSLSCLWYITVHLLIFETNQFILNVWKMSKYPKIWNLFN